MSKKIAESYLRLSNAIADNPPVCSEPEYIDLFFGDDYTQPGRQISQYEKIRLQNEAEAKIICNFCPVKTLCAEYAILANEPYGVFGGTTPADRKAISSARTKPEPTTARRLFD